MEAGAGWRGGADGRKGIRTRSISVRYVKPGKGAGARGGGPRGMGEEVGRPGAGPRHATQPAPGTAAGGRAITGAESTMAQHGMLADNKDTRKDGRERERKLVIQTEHTL